MNTKQMVLQRWFKLLGVLLFIIGLIGLTGAGLRPTQAGSAVRRTPTPTRTPARSPTPTNTATPASPPYASPTPGPTTPVSGTWKIVSSPNVGTGTFGNQLNAVAVVSANNVWAVGFSPDPSGTPLYIRRSLVERWDGSSWSVVTSPNPAGKTDVRLNGLAAVSASDMWAVGHSGDPSTIPYQTLTEHWNGTSWTIITSPSPGTYNGNDLNAVAAIAPNDVWAVGWYQSGSTGQDGGALTMHWDGARWSVVPNPSRSTLYAVTARASNDVWATGDQVILHWDGATWSSVAFPQPPGGGFFISLRGLSATSARDIWAVGFRQWAYFSGYLNSPVAYHWDGAAWSLVPNAGATYEYFWSVAAIAPNDVWAVGDNGQTQHWNGAAWSRVSAPYPNTGGRFYAVAAGSSSSIWAVGESSLRTWVDPYSVP